MNIQKPNTENAATHAGAGDRRPETEADRAALTLITSENPDILGKYYALTRSGRLEKEIFGFLTSGTAEVGGVSDLTEFADLLGQIGDNQALTYGIPQTSPIALTTQAEWERKGKPDDEIPRTNETFSWFEGPGIMMIDNDPEDEDAVLDPNALIQILKSAVPGLADVEMLTYPSASSWIRNTKTGAWLSQLRGQRVYLMVADASDIERAGQVLFDRLWLAGHGYFKVSSAGTLLSRTLVDGSVYQPSRLDFVAGAVCKPPLVQERGTPQIVPGTSKIVDTREALPDLTAREKKLLKHMQDVAREEKRPEAEARRNAWLDERAHKMAGPNASEEAIAAARARAEVALDTRALPGDFVLDVMLDGKIEEVTVAQILEVPAKYHCAKTRDPLEPDYDDGRLVGKLFVNGTIKRLHSFAHGEATYTLETSKTEIEIPQGQLDKAVDDTLDVLRKDPNFFDFGDAFVLIDNGKIHRLDQHMLEQRLGGLVQYWAWGGRNKRIWKDPPGNLAKRILSLADLRRLKPLVAVITAPTLRPDGSTLDAPGYDPETKLYYHCPDGVEVPAVPLNPSEVEIKEALADLELPFKDFPFVDAVDRGVFLSALLTASVRGVLPTAPGFAFDAPVQGSGKTLLALCVAALAGDQGAAVYPHSSGRDDEEVRKRLMSFFLTGAPAMVWDNVLGRFDSASLSSTLTSETYTDRILQRSEIRSLPNKAMFLFTGNNLELQEDLVRRILICRIDPCTDQPYKREFDLDPLDYVRTHRPVLIAAALTLLRGYLSSDYLPPAGRLASFDAWSDWVRDTVCWIGEVIAPGGYVDPIKAVDRALEFDPTFEVNFGLLSALKEQFGTEPFTSADVFKLVRNQNDMRTHGTERKIWEALMAISENSTRTAQAIGKVLGYRKDRIAGGLVLRKTLDTHTKQSVWRVEDAG